MKRLPVALLDTRKIRGVLPAKPQFARDDFLSEIAFADEQRHNKNPRGENPAKYLPNIRLLFPKCFLNLRENFSPPKLIRMLKCRGSRISIQRGAVSDEYQCRV